jgi:hypothetical protein
VCVRYDQLDGSLDGSPRGQSGPPVSDSKGEGRRLFQNQRRASCCTSSGAVVRRPLSLLFFSSLSVVRLPGAFSRGPRQQASYVSPVQCMWEN